MDVVRALLSSKKAVTAIAAILFTIANSLGSLPSRRNP